MMVFNSHISEWNSIRPGQHWVLDSSGEVQVKNKKNLNICQIFSGCNSLANNIDAMAQEILTECSGRILTHDEFSALITLKGKVEEKVQHYNQSHWCIYRFAMKFFGRNVNVAQKKFNDIFVEIANFQQNAKRFVKN